VVRRSGERQLRPCRRMLADLSVQVRLTSSNPVSLDRRTQVCLDKGVKLICIADGGPAFFSSVVAESEFRIDSWENFQAFYAGLDQSRGRWWFRGQQSAGWPLETSLERVTRGYRDRRLAGLFFINSFKKRAHQFLRTVPSEDDLLEWLAVMQHWGVPTRLLDFTTSAYVGLFFAVNDFPFSSGQLEKREEPVAALWGTESCGIQGYCLHAAQRGRKQ
jgi:hypothetical protein